MNHSKDNIILIGMPGVGKSTVGVVLAKIMGYNFIDTDILIQEQEKCVLKDIIREKGIDGFIEIENKIICNIYEERAVIATGGSVVYGREAMEHLRDIGTVIYLKLGYKRLRGRLGNIKNRGVILRKDQSLKDLYKERVPLYEEYAHIVIDETNRNVEETVEMLLEKLT